MHKMQASSGRWRAGLTAVGLLAALALGGAAPLVAQAADAPAASAAGQYRIGPGDSLKIAVYQSQDLNLDVKVTDAGMISFPLIGGLRVAGLTVSEAEVALAEALRKGDYIKNPQVNVVVTNVRANQVNVLGQVAKPGRYPLDVAGMRLTEVLALAGGIAAAGAAEGGGSDIVQLVGTRDGKPYRTQVDLPRIFAPGGRDLDVVIMPGDAIWVERAPLIYVYGQVQKPGQLRLEREMTVMQALAAAGGLTARGTARGLRVNRKGADGKLQTLEPQMNDELRAGDVVYIQESLF